MPKITVVDVQHKTFKKAFSGYDHPARSISFSTN